MSPCFPKERMTTVFNPEINKIFLDMDGVLADFDRFLIENFGRTFPHTEGPRDMTMWDLLASVDHLYFKLEPTPYCMELVDLARSLSPQVEVLTAIPRRATMPDAEPDKRAWIKKYVDDEMLVNIGPYSSDKWKHARPGDIIVDDRPDNIKDWAERGGGIGILHDLEDFPSTRRRLLLAAQGLYKTGEY